MESKSFARKSFKQALVEGKSVTEAADAELFGRKPSGWEDGLNSLALWKKNDNIPMKRGFTVGISFQKRNKEFRSIGRGWALSSTRARSDSTGDFVRKFKAEENLEEMVEIAQKVSSVPVLGSEVVSVKTEGFGFENGNELLLDAVVESSCENISVELEKIKLNEELDKQIFSQLNANVNKGAEFRSTNENCNFILKEAKAVKASSVESLLDVRNYTIGVPSVIAVDIVSAVADLKKDLRTNSTLKKGCMMSMEKLQHSHVILKNDERSIVGCPRVRVVADGIHNSYYSFKSSFESIGSLSLDNKQQNKEEDVDSVSDDGFLSPLQRIMKTKNLILNTDSAVDIVTQHYGISSKFLFKIDSKNHIEGVNVPRYAYKSLNQAFAALNLLKKRNQIRLLGGGPKSVKKRAPIVTTRRTESNNSVDSVTNFWSEIFMIGPFDQQGESTLTEERVEKFLLSVPDSEAIESIRFLTNGFYESFSENIELDKDILLQKWRRQSILEKARRSSLEFEEFGLSALIVKNLTESVTAEALMITSCKVLKNFFQDRGIVFLSEFVFPSESDRLTKEKAIIAVRSIFRMHRELCDYWGKTPSFKWLLNVVSEKCKVTSNEFSTLYKMFGAVSFSRMNGSRDAEQKKQLLKVFSKWVDDEFINCTTEDISAWPVCFHSQLAKKFGIKLRSKLSMRNSQKALVEGYRWIDLFSTLSRKRCQSYTSVISIIFHFLPSECGFNEIRHWNRISRAANISKLMGDLWSVRSKYIFSDYELFTDAQSAVILKFLKWLVYCYTTFLLFTEKLLEKVQKELRNYLSVHKDSDIIQYIHFKRDFEVEQWIERIHPEWLKVQPSSSSIVKETILNKFPESHTIGSIVESQSSVPTSIISEVLVSEKPTMENFEEDFVDYGTDVEEELRQSIHVKNNSLVDTNVITQISTDQNLGGKNVDQSLSSSEALIQNVKETNDEYEKRVNDEFAIFQMLLREEEEAEEQKKKISHVEQDKNSMFWSNSKRISNSDVATFKQNLQVEKDEKAPRIDWSVNQKRKAIDLVSPLSTPRPPVFSNKNKKSLVFDLRTDSENSKVDKRFQFDSPVSNSKKISLNNKAKNVEDDSAGLVDKVKEIKLENVTKKELNKVSVFQRINFDRQVENSSSILSSSIIEQNIADYKEEVELNQMYDRFMRNENAECDYTRHVSGDDLRNGESCNVNKQMLLSMFKKVREREEREFLRYQKIEEDQKIFKAQQEKLVKAITILESEKLQEKVIVTKTSRPSQVYDTFDNSHNLFQAVNMKANDTVVLSVNSEDAQAKLSFSNISLSTNEKLPRKDLFTNYYNSLKRKMDGNLQKEIAVTNTKIVKANFDHVRWLDFTSKLNASINPVTNIGICFSNLCARVKRGDMAADTLFVMISRTNLIAGLPAAHLQWDDLEEDHIVALYKCITTTSAPKTAITFSFIFIAYLLVPQKVFVSDQHDEGVIRSTELPENFYVPKALSVLREMCVSVNSLESVLTAKFIHPKKMLRSCDNWQFNFGVSAKELQLIDSVSQNKTKVTSRIYDEVEFRKDDEIYQSQSNFIRQQLAANEQGVNLVLKSVTNSSCANKGPRYNPIILSTDPTPPLQFLSFSNSNNNVENNSIRNSFNNLDNINNNNINNNSNINDNRSLNNFLNSTSNSNNEITAINNNNELADNPNNKEKNVDNGKYYYDVNNNAYVCASNAAQNQELVDNHFVLARQFESEDQRKLRLGTSFLHYTFLNFLNTVLSATVSDSSGMNNLLIDNEFGGTFNLKLFASLDRRVGNLKTTKACESDENFKKVCLWQWDSSDVNKVNLSWFLSEQNKASVSFKRLQDLEIGFREFEIFLVLTFGLIWKHCMSVLIEDIQINENVQQADCGYLRYKFEHSCCVFGALLKKQSTNESMDKGSFWVVQFKKLMKTYIDTVSFQEQEGWRRLVRDDKVLRVKDSVNVGNIVSQSAGIIASSAVIPVDSKPICIKYLKHALKIVNPTTNLVFENCSNLDCKRQHNEVFNKTKKTVIAALDTAPGDNSITKNVVTLDQRFK